MWVRGSQLGVLKEINPTSFTLDQPFALLFFVGCFVVVGDLLYLGATVKCVHYTAPIYVLFRTEYGSQNQCGFA